MKKQNKWMRVLCIVLAALMVSGSAYALISLLFL
jgi:hypothetical protein